MTDAPTAPPRADEEGFRIRALERERGEALAVDRFDRVEHIDDELARLGVLRVPPPVGSELTSPAPRPGT